MSARPNPAPAEPSDPAPTLRRGERERSTTVDAIVAGASCVLALVVFGAYARRFHPGFDEHWHVFMAGVQPWSQFLAELRWDAHPPLSYLVLRWLVPLRGSEWWPRLPSIVPAIASVFLAQRAARAFGLGPAAAGLAGLMFAVASTHANLAIAVRAYSLATCFTMAALWFLARMSPGEPAARRDVVSFVVAASLACWTEYSACFAVVAMLVARVLHDARDDGVALRLVRSLRNEAAPIGALGLTLAGVLWWLSSTHAAGQVGHVHDFFRTPGESVPAFAMRGALRTLDYFAPLGISARHAPWAVAPLVLGVLGWLAGNPRRAPLATMIVVVWTSIFVLALGGLYPLGGLMRHQFVLFPFFVLAAATVVDGLLRRARHRGVRAIVALGFAAWTIATGARGFTADPVEEFSSVPTLWSADIVPMTRITAADEILYTGRIDAIALYSNLRDATWTATERGPRQDVFLVARPDAAAIRVVRSDDWWLPSPLDDAAASDLAATMRRHGAAKASVVALVLEPRPVSSQRRDNAPVRALLARHGLVLGMRRVSQSGETLRVSLDDGTTGHGTP